ncbi:MAG TPA: SagB/ThcOx family dehydrogenase [Anaerolineae bacterium]|nr:SagB/ThcOx family dehydrogenase [Anaerolineae bacterium]
MTTGIGQEFIKRTKYRYLGPSDQERRLPQPPMEKAFEEEGEWIRLPDPGEEAPDLKEIIDGRTSVRNYTDAPISLQDLSYLLWCTQGVKEVAGAQATLRTVPSAGARHAIETYLLVNRVYGLPPGLYQYRSLEHQLQEFTLYDGIADMILEAGLKQRHITGSAVTFIWAATAYRMTWRYGERGYRYLFLDVGHVCQNLYLAAESIGCGVCAIAAFDDDRMNELLHLDGKEEFVLYLATLGAKVQGLK